MSSNHGESSEEDYEDMEAQREDAEADDETPG
jgi:hypothetical protein